MFRHIERFIAKVYGPVAELQRYIPPHAMIRLFTPL